MTKQDKDIRVNARGLSNPGPRLMVESAMADGGVETMRVVVSSKDALEDLQAFFTSRGLAFESDHIGDDYHIVVQFMSND